MLGGLPASRGLGHPAAASNLNRSRQEPSAAGAAAAAADPFAALTDAALRTNAAITPNRNIIKGVNADPFFDLGALGGDTIASKESNRI